MISRKVIHSAPCGCVDGLKIKKYVYQHISFNLPDHIYDFVDTILEDFWQNTGNGSCVYAEDFEEALCRLVQYDVLLGPGHIRCISSLIIDGMHYHGYIEKYS